MNAKDAILITMDTSLVVLKAYFSDLTDAELLTRPYPGCNHLAWQLGHLIKSESEMLNMLRAGSGPELPAGFVEAHSKENAGSDDPSKFGTRQQYVDLLDKVRAASKAALEKCSDADLDQPGPEPLRNFCPTVGSLFCMIGTHPMMHAGQFVPVRRALGKPVVI